MKWIPRDLEEKIDDQKSWSESTSNSNSNSSSSSRVTLQQEARGCLVSWYTLLRKLLLVAVNDEKIKHHGYFKVIYDTTIACRYSQISTSKGQLFRNDLIPYEIPSDILLPMKITPKKPLVTKIRPEDLPIIQTTLKMGNKKNDGIDEIIGKWNWNGRMFKK
ncbi:hypothetical protein M0804_010184 [Polistes exclamans]|nr:hypothetical protein M0804_010184 [Polistes exclamans]